MRQSFHHLVDQAIGRSLCSSRGTLLEQQQRGTAWDQIPERDKPGRMLLALPLETRHKLSQLTSHEVRTAGIRCWLGGTLTKRGRRNLAKVTNA